MPNPAAPAAAAAREQMKIELESYWMNYRTGQYESRPQGFILTATDEQALDYLPQDPSVKGMFQCLRDMGKSVPDAMIYVLETVSGTEHAKPAAATKAVSAKGESG